MDLCSLCPMHGGCVPLRLHQGQREIRGTGLSSSLVQWARASGLTEARCWTVCPWGGLSPSASWSGSGRSAGHRRGLARLLSLSPAADRRVAQRSCVCGGGRRAQHTLPPPPPHPEPRGAPAQGSVCLARSPATYERSGAGGWPQLSHLDPGVTVRSQLGNAPEPWPGSTGPGDVVTSQGQQRGS